MWIHKSRFLDGSHALWGRFHHQSALFPSSMCQTNTNKTMFLKMRSWSSCSPWSSFASVSNKHYLISLHCSRSFSSNNRYIVKTCNITLQTFKHFRNFKSNYPFLILNEDSIWVQWGKTCLYVPFTTISLFFSYQPTRPDRGWFVFPFGKNPWWIYLASALPALLVTILIFMDEQITAVIVNRKENKLKVCSFVNNKLKCNVNPNNYLSYFLLLGLLYCIYYCNNFVISLW